MHTNQFVFDHSKELPADLLSSCREMPYPKTVLMCRPDFYNVVDVKNPHMENNVGSVDTVNAKKQWDFLCETFVSTNASVELIEPVVNCEDMVFCANQTLVGLDKNGNKICIPSKMKFASRQREVGVFVDWFGTRGYRIENSPQCFFEGSGDAIWHPGRALIWGGADSALKARLILISVKLLMCL